MIEEGEEGRLDKNQGRRRCRRHYPAKEKTGCWIETALVKVCKVGEEVEVVRFRLIVDAVMVAVGLEVAPPLGAADSCEAWQKHAALSAAEDRCGSETTWTQK